MQLLLKIQNGTKLSSQLKHPAISRGNTSPNPSSHVPAIGYECSCWDDLTWPQNLTESTCRTTYLKLNLKNHMNINSKKNSVPLSDWNKPCNHQLHWTSKFKMSQPFWNHLFFSHSKTTTWSQVTPSIISAVFPFWSAFESVFLAPSGFLSFLGVSRDRQAGKWSVSFQGRKFIQVEVWFFWNPKANHQSVSLFEL